MHRPTRSVVIHGHFYQPPRENPWTGTVEAQPSAAPHHDWNARIEQECYRAVVAARIPGEGGRIRKIVNTLHSISFNFGPTLLAWMEKEAPRTYRAILEADCMSQATLGGHGNAIAQAYHHAILPLATRKDKVTEVRWGIEDFRRRFHREPAGMWLPETAVDAETLDVLAQEGVAFTIVAPHQIENLPKGGLPGLYRTRSGRTIALFAYDGPLSHDVAFGPLLKDAEAWAGRIAADEGSTRLVSMATDGETYGHHHRFGEMALAAVLDVLQNQPNIRVENFASFLSHSPPVEEVALVENTSWSCSHGIERWRGEGGCKMSPEVETQQAWKAPLREAMEWLAGEVHELYEEHAPALLGDPWKARNDYGRVVAGMESIGAFLDACLPKGSGTPERFLAAELLELERYSLRLFTSCGWFFDDLARVEPLQILRYAARALEMAEGLMECSKPPDTRKVSMEETFLSILGKGHSNEDPPRSGATFFLDEVRPSPRAQIQSACRSSAGGGEDSIEATIGRALVAALSALAEDRMEAPEVQKAIDDARILAQAHALKGLPIPFDAQTVFFQMIERASDHRLEALSALREPLGFVGN